MILLKYLWMNAPSIFFIVLLVRVSDYRECKPMFVKDNLAIRTSDDIEGTKKKSVLIYVEREWSTKILIVCLWLVILIVKDYFVFIWKGSKYFACFFLSLLAVDVLNFSWICRSTFEKMRHLLSLKYCS